MIPRENFYVYLTSNGNQVQYTENESSSFTNIIRPSLNLDDEFEVALVNILFKNDIIAVHKHDIDYHCTVEVKFTDEHGTVVSGYSVKYTPQIDFIANNLDDLINIFDKDLITFLGYNKVIESSTTDYIFRYSKFDNCTFQKKIKVIFPDKRTDLKAHVKAHYGRKLKKLLGLTDGNNNLDTIPQFPNPIEIIYVYSDIVEPSVMGNQSVHLLDIIPINNIYSKTGTLTTYKRVNQKIVDTISLKLTDQNGGSLNFAKDVNVTGILHFRRI